MLLVPFGGKKLCYKYCLTGKAVQLASCIHIFLSSYPDAQILLIKLFCADFSGSEMKSNNFWACLDLEPLGTAPDFQGLYNLLKVDF